MVHQWVVVPTGVDDPGVRYLDEGPGWVKADQGSGESTPGHLPRLRSGDVTLLSLVSLPRRTTTVPVGTSGSFGLSEGLPHPHVSQPQYSELDPESPLTRTREGICVSDDTCRLLGTPGPFPPVSSGVW